MEKFYGKVGYADTIETAPSVYEDSITEKYYYGDVLRNMSRWVSSDKVQSDLKIRNQISIVADAYAFKNFSRIKYVQWMDVLWSVSEIEVSRPRLILTLGGEYNG